MGVEVLLNGHAFSDRGVCVNCGLDLDQYEEQREPQCVGKKRTVVEGPEPKETALED